nr:MAG TPA: repressor domain protein [Caudoviricetes sp.]
MLDTTTHPSTRVFECAMFGQLRTATQQDKIFFCLSDVTKALDLQVNKVKNRLKRDGWNTIPTVTLTTNQHGKTTEQVNAMTYIDEANLYRCIFQSRKAEAEKFQDWVFEEVLPAIRKDGGYIAQVAEDTPETLMARALKVADATLSNYEQRIRQQQERIEAQTQQLQLQAPKVQYADEVLSARGTYTTTQMAKELGLSSAIKLHNLLKAGGDMFKRSEQWFVTAKHAGKDLTAVRTTAYIDHQGKSATRLTTVWTEKGRAWLHSKFGQSESAASLFDQLSVKGGAK